MSRLPYAEGDVFAVPLEGVGYGLGVIARCPPEGKVLVGYFFNNWQKMLPAAGCLPELAPGDAVLAVKFGDLSLLRRDWPVVGHIPHWNRRNWPMPSFLRRDPLSEKRAWKVTYSEDNPSKQVLCEAVSPHVALQPDALLGAGAVEMALLKIANEA